MLAEKIFSVAHVADQLVLWFLVFLSIMSVGLIIERFIYLRKIAKQSQAVRERAKLALQTNNIADVEELAKNPENLEGRALSLGLRHIKESGTKGLDEMFNSFLLVERPELEKNLNFLATLGSNAPYIGLFGTVLGIMKAFQDLAVSSEAGQQTVMAGISMALVATAAGLFVAIPAVIFYNYFQKQVKSIIQSLECAKELCMVYAKKKGL
jgi:biopolymer transport protein ExbB